MSVESPFTCNDILPTNLNEYVRDYQEELEQPLNIINHIGVVSFPSDDSTLHERTEALSHYLHNPNSPNVHWGRTIFAEPISRGLLQTALAPVFNKKKLSIQLAPTSMDSSVNAEGYYQKGCDLCIVRDDRDDIFRPVCGIDVTLAGKPVVRSKRKRPGFQSFACMPVIVLPLDELGYEGTRSDGFPNKRFSQYLDEHAHKAVKRGNPLDGFYGLSKEEALSWKKTIASNMTVAIERCKESLYRNHHQIKSYPYHSEVIRLLNEMDQTMEDYTRHVKKLR